MPNNPSEVQRLTEEYEHLKAALERRFYRDKPTREKLLNELRAVERQLGILPANYNSSDF